MKKGIWLLLCAAFLLSSCGKKADLVAYEIPPAAYSESGSSGPWCVRTEDIPQNHPEETLSVTFDGKTYTGKYVYDSQKHGNSYRSCFYEFNGGIFSVKETTGQVDYIRSTMLSTGGKTEAECEAEAARVASRFINLEDYALTVLTEDTSLSFCYVRHIAGVETGAKLTVTMKTYGGLYKLYSVELQMTDEIEAYIQAHGLSETEALAKRFSSEAGRALVKEKIKESYPNHAGFTMQDGVLTVSGDGQLGMLYEVIVDRRDRDGEYTMERSEVAQIVVTADRAGA